MSDERHSEAKRAFLEACELKGDARTGFLDALSRNDPGLSALVDRLIAHDVDEGPDTTAGSAIMHRPVSVGERLGPYLIVSELGRGAQGTVYLAEDGRLGRRVALKILSATRIRDASQIEDRMRHFWREAEITSSLDHAGICTVFDAGVIDDVAYIAMRWIPGETLADRIASGRDEGARSDERIPVILNLFEKIGRALHAAHESGVIHRDVKPGNIMVTPEGEPVILDFGLARSVAGSRPASSIGALRGTPEYMSPEQLAADRIDLDRRTDVFSLGVALFESLTRVRPFQGDTPEALYHAIMTKEPPDARRLEPAIDADLSVVLQTALQKDRDHRYRSALDFADDLRRVRLHEPTAARPTGPLTRLRRWAQRHPLAAMAAAVIVFLASGVILLVALLLGKAAERRISEGRAQSERAYRLVSEADATLKRDPARALSLLEEALAAAPGLPVGDLALEIAMKLRGKTYLIGHDAEVVDAAFSSDGQRVVTGSLDGTARTWNADSGALTAAMSVAPDRKIRGVGWIAGDPVVLTAGGDHVVTLLAFDGRILRAFAPHGDRVTAVTLSRDGQRVLSASIDGTARVNNVGTHAAPWVLHHGAPLVSATFNWDETRVVTVAEDGRVHVFSNERDAPAIFGPAITVKDDLGDASASWRPRSAALGSAAVLAIVQSHATGSHRLITLDTSTSSPGVEWGRHDPSAPLAFSPDGADLITTVDQRAAIRRAATGETIAPIPENPGALRKAVFSPQGGRFLTTSLEGPAIVWSLRDITRVLAPGQSSEVPFAWDPATAASVPIPFAGPPDEKPPTWADVRGVSPDGRLIATATGPTGTRGDIVRICEAGSGACIHTFTNERLSVPSVSFSHDGAVCAVVDDGGPSVTVRDLDRNSDLLVIAKSRNADLVTLSPNGRFLVARVDPAASDPSNRARRDLSELVVWNLQKGGEIVLSRSAGSIASITFSPDGDALFVVGAQGAAMLVDLDNGMKEIILSGKKRPSGAVAFSLDGTLLAAAALDQSIAFWRTKTGELVTSAVGHRQDVRQLAFSPDGGRLVSVSADRTLRVWNAANGAQVASALVSDLRYACFSPSGKEIVAVAREGSTDRVRVLGAVDALEKWRPRAGSFYGFSPAGRFIVVFTCEGDFEQVPLDPLGEIVR